MARYSPSVLPDDRTDRRPGLEVADAFAHARREGIEDRLLEEEDIDRTRRREREDISDAAAEVEFERYVEDVLGGVPVEEGAGQPGPGARAPGGPGVRGGLDPEVTRPLFEDARIGMQRQAAPPPPPDPEEGKVIALPGQFMGGDFQPTTVRMPTRRTRTLAGREFELDPSRTAEARGRAREEEERARVREEMERDVAALVAAGMDPMEAQAMVEAAPSAIPDHFRPEEEPRPSDMNPLHGEFESPEAMEAFLEYRRRLALADAAGRGRGGSSASPDDGPISVEDALAELDQMYGEFDRSGNLVGHRLDERERFRLATLWSEGRLRETDLPEIEEEGEGPAPEDVEPGWWERFTNWISGGGDDQEDPAGGPPTSEAGPARPGQPTGDPVLDSLRSIAREYRGRVDDATLREIMLDEGYKPHMIDAVIGGG